MDDEPLESDDIRLLIGARINVCCMRLSLVVLMPDKQNVFQRVVDRAAYSQILHLPGRTKSLYSSRYSISISSIFTKLFSPHIFVFSFFVIYFFFLCFCDVAIAFTLQVYVCHCRIVVYICAP